MPKKSAFSRCATPSPPNLNQLLYLSMKTIFLLLLALAIAVFFGGTAYFLIDVSKGAQFERTDQAAVESEN